MQLGLRNYIIRDRNGTYYFRRPIPERLRRFMPAPFTGKANWKLTMGTKEPKIAKAEHGKMLQRCDLDFEAAEMKAALAVRKTLTGEDIQSIANWYRDSHILEDDDFRVASFREDEAVYQEVAAQAAADGIAVLNRWAETEQPPLPMSALSERQVKRKKATSRYLIQVMREALSRGDTAAIESDVVEVLEQFGVELDLNAPSYRALALALLEASIEASDKLLRRYSGEIVQSPENVPEPMGDGRLPADLSKPSAGGITIREAFEHWQKVSSARPRSVDEFERAAKLFVEFRGNVPIASLTRDDGVNFRSALQKLPVLKYRKDKLRFAKMPALIEWSNSHPNSEKLAPASVNKITTALATMCQLARDDGKIKAAVWENPFRVRKIGNKTEGRLEFSPEDLHKIFNSPIYCEGKRPKGGAGEAAFWMPLLALFHGSRESELGQLLVGDVQCEQGVWHYVIMADDGSGVQPGKSVKVTGKRTKVPLHSEVLRCGFLAFVEKRKRADGAKARLFDELKTNSKGQIAAGWAKWWGRWTRNRLGITDKRKVFHSMRHAWKDAARAAGVSEEVSDAITSHSGGGQGRKYGQRGISAFKLSKLQEAIELVRFDVDLRHIQNMNRSKTSR